MIVINQAKAAANQRDQANTAARAYLAETDWYVIRLQETGTPVPAEVLQARQAARDAIVALLD